MSAVPLVVVTSTTVSTEFGPSSVTGTKAVPTPSSTATEPMVSVGRSLSVTVTVPVAFVLAVLPLVTVPTTENISVGSPTLSSLIGTDTATVSVPAGIVMVVVVSA